MKIWIIFPLFVCSFAFAQKSNLRTLYGLIEKGKVKEGIFLYDSGLSHSMSNNILTFDISASSLRPTSEIKEIAKKIYTYYPNSDIAWAKYSNIQKGKGYTRVFLNGKALKIKKTNEVAIFPLNFVEQMPKKFLTEFKPKLRLVDSIMHRANFKKNLNLIYPNAKDLKILILDQRNLDKVYCENLLSDSSYYEGEFYNKILVIQSNSVNFIEDVISNFIASTVLVYNYKNEEEIIRTDGVYGMRVILGPADSTIKNQFYFCEDGLTYRGYNGKPLTATDIKKIKVKWRLNKK